MASELNTTSPVLYKRKRPKSQNLKAVNEPSKQELLQCAPFVIPLLELTYTNHVKPCDRPAIKGSDDAYTLLYHSWDKKKIEIQEQFKVLMLNRANHAIGLYELSTGGIVGTIADPKLIFAAALKAGASSIVTAHNHPSGNLNPSSRDEELTNKIRQAGKLLEIDLLDHIIVTPYGYYSFANEGLI